MSSITTTQAFTAEQLFRMPKDSFRYELVEGVLKKMSPAGSKHGQVAATLTMLLGQHIKAHKLGIFFAAETGFKIASSPDTVIAPDVSFVRQAEVDRLGETEKFWPGAPDLAVEVVSPGDTAREVRDKVAMWLAAGARMVWVVRAKERTISVHRAQTDTLVLTGDDVLDGSDVVPGFNCTVAEVFA